LLLPLINKNKFIFYFLKNNNKINITLWWLLAVVNVWLFVAVVCCGLVKKINKSDF
jgi:hypothetical protein